MVCPDWDIYSRIISQLLTSFAIITGSIGTGALLIYINHSSYIQEIGTASIIAPFWVVCIFINDVAEVKFEEKQNIVLKFILAPILCWFYITMLVTKKYFQRA